MAKRPLPRRFSQPPRRNPRTVGQVEPTQSRTELTPRQTPPGTVRTLDPFAKTEPPPQEKTKQQEKQQQQTTQQQQTSTPTTTPPPPPPPITPFVPGNYGQDYVSRTGMSLNQLNEIAKDPARAGELTSILMNAQYGPGAPVGGQFGDYLRSQASTIGAITQFLDQLGIAGGFVPQGGAYRTFENAWEGLGAGPGTAHPGQTSIADWRNLIYGGEGAKMPGGFLNPLGTGDRVRSIEPGTLSAARSYLDSYIHPLLGGSIGDTTWGSLMNMLPDLWTRYNKEIGSQTNAPLWAQWLRNGGYLPTRAL